MSNLTNDVKQGSAWFTEAQFEQMRRDERVRKEWQWASEFENRPPVTKEERELDLKLIREAIDEGRFKSYGEGFRRGKRGQPKPFSRKQRARK